MAARFYAMSQAQADELESLVTRMRDLTFEATPDHFKTMTPEMIDANLLAKMFGACVTAMSHRPGGVKNESLVNGYAIALGQLLAAEVPADIWPLALAAVNGNALDTAEQITTGMTPPTQARN